MKGERLAVIDSSFGSIEVECVTNLEDLHAKKGRWDALTNKAGVHAPYLTFQWFFSALKTIDRDKRPLLIFFKMNGEDVGLIPLVVREESHLGIKFWIVSFVQNPYTPYQRFIYTIDLNFILVSLLKFLKQKFGNRFILDLDEVRLSDAEERAVIELNNRKVFLLRQEPKDGSRYLILDHSFEKTLSKLKKKTQKEFRRKINRLSKLGNINLSRIKGEVELDKHLASFFSFYARTWKGAEPHPEFYYHLCKAFDQMDRLYFYSLNIDDDPIAYLICIADKNVMYGIKTTYDPSYYAFSPGVVLFYKAIEDMFNIPGIEEFDIGRGHEQFKKEWTSLVHAHTRLILYPYVPFWQVMIYIRYIMIPKLREYAIMEELYGIIKKILSISKAPPSSIEPPESKKVTKRLIKRSDLLHFQVPLQYIVRFASTEDLDRLVVAMAVRNFKIIQHKLNKQKCLVVLLNSRVVAYFWLLSQANSDMSNHSKAVQKTIVINDWGISNNSANKSSHQEFMQIAASYLFNAFPDVESITIPFYS